MRVPARAAIAALTLVAACSDEPTPTAAGPLAHEARSGDATTRMGPSPIDAPRDVGVRLVAAGLTSPVTVVSAHDRTGRLFVVDQAGQIRVLTKDGTLLPQPFLDVSSKSPPLNPRYDERATHYETSSFDA